MFVFAGNMIEKSHLIQMLLIFVVLDWAVCCVPWLIGLVWLREFCYFVFFTLCLVGLPGRVFSESVVCLHFLCRLAWRPAGDRVPGPFA